MKVYSWKTLLLTIFVGGGCFIYQILQFNDFWDMVWLGFFSYLIVQGLRVSFLKAAYEEDIKRGERARAVYRKLFGTFAPLAPYSPSIFLLFIWAVSIFLPTLEWLMLVLLVVYLLYAIWFVIISKKHMRLEAVQEFLRNYKTEHNSNEKPT